MGKGYNNYMCKKPFHPGSKANIKRTWIAEQRTENEKKKQDDLKVQYEKEQDLYNNRALISTESKDKLELNFMYEAPPGAKRERQKEDDEPEYKFEWQRKYNAPREDFAKNNTEIRDQPFGIPVRNVRCIKCHKWGHINTDKECPLFSQASTSSLPTTSMDPLELMRQMREDGYNLKQNVLGHRLNPQAANQQFLDSEEEDPEVEFLKSLSSKQKHKLLKKLNKMSKKEAKCDSSMNKKKKSKKKHRSKMKCTESDLGDKKESKKKTAKKKSLRKSSGRSVDVDTTKNSDSPGNDEQASKEKTKEAVDQRNEYSNSSESSVRDVDESKKKEGGKKSVTCLSEYKYVSKKSKQPKEKQKDFFLVKHSLKNKGGKDSEDHSFKCSNTDKGEKDVTKMDFEQVVKVTSSKDESKKVSTVVKQEVADTSPKSRLKRKSSDSGSDSGSSGTESSLEDCVPKHMKFEVKFHSLVEEASDHQEQMSCSVGSKASGSKSSTKAIGTALESPISEASQSPEHPDKFTCPLAVEPEFREASNLATFLLERKYHGDKDEKFRKVNRDRRSPSFKQKYRLT